MSARRYRSRRRLRSEILPLASVVLLSLAVYGLFPRGAFAFRPSPDAAAPSVGCAFVTLTPAQEAAALAAARTSWQSRGRASSQPVEMLPRELPEIPHAPAADLDLRPGLGSARPGLPHVDLLPPTLAAERPASIPRGKEEPAKRAFPREEMLRLRD